MVRSSAYVDRDGRFPVRCSILSDTRAVGRQNCIGVQLNGPLTFDVNHLVERFVDEYNADERSEALLCTETKAFGVYFH